MREIGDIIQEAQRRPGETLALATLVKTHGSSYRRTGARMLITRDGTTVGSLSGGCLEDEVVEKAREVMQTGDSALMTFDTRRRFGCNGALEILVEKVRHEFFTTLVAHYHARRPCLIATSHSLGSRCLEAMTETGHELLIEPIEPPVQLLVFGTGSDSDALRGLAGILGWPMQTLHTASELEKSYDAWTAAVVKTHNYGRDFAALRALFAMDLRYIGLMGPRTRREQLLGDLLDTGVEPKSNLFAPAGLDLGSNSPETIALAIVAEIQTIFSGGSQQSLRTRNTPIHAPEPGKLAAIL